MGDRNNVSAEMGMAGVWRVPAFAGDDGYVMSLVLLRVGRRGNPPTHLGSGPVSGYGVTFLRRKDGLVG